MVKPANIAEFTQILEIICDKPASVR